MMAATPLHRLVKNATGQNMHTCRGCGECDLPYHAEQDIPLASVIQLIIFDDDEVLTSRTVWSENIYNEAGTACKRGINLKEVIDVLREEARNRGLV